MTHKLPANLLALFSPRPGLRWIPAGDHAPEERVTSNIGGLAQFLPALEEYKQTIPYEPTESWLQRKDRLKAEKKERQARSLEEGVDRKPDEDPGVRGDAFKTLFVARLSYDTTEKDLEREFGRFGPIERIRIVVDSTAETNGTASESEAKPKQLKKKKKAHRGYAFVVYEREKDMKAAYKETDGIRIKDRRVLVDVERGRTVKGWRPRRLGGGLGGRGYTKAAPARPTGFGGGFTAAPAGPGGFRGGFRGGFDRGGFRGGFRGGDRGGFGGGRGGIGYQGGGGFGGGGRGGYGGGGSPHGSGAPPPNAPSGPGGRGGQGGGYAGSPANGTNGYADAGRGGYGGEPRRNDYDDRSSYRGGGGGYGGGGGFTGSNREPVRPRDGGYGDRDRDRGYSRGRDDDVDRKRPYDGGGYEDPRKLRRY